MRVAALALAAVALAGCGSTVRPVARKVPAAHAVLAAKHQRCAASRTVRLRTAALAFGGVAIHGATAYRQPGRTPFARFGPRNVNGAQTVLGVLSVLTDGACRATWYHVQLPLKPNGSTGYVRASALSLATVHTRIVVDLSERKLELYRSGRPVLRATVAVGSLATPTPTGSFYVNQRLIPENASGPYGPGAVGVSAFSEVLTGWAQGGPVAIHGTDAPWSIGRPVSNGCIRLPNATLRRVFAAAAAGTPVTIRP